MKNLSIHVNAGYYSYVLISIMLILLVHVGLVFVLLNYSRKKNEKEKEILFSFVDRFNFLFGVLIVISFEGLLSDAFQYRKWAYGVIKSESIIEKIDEDWNSNQLEKSKEVSKTLDKSIEEYTDGVFLKWKNLKNQK